MVIFYSGTEGVSRTMVPQLKEFTLMWTYDILQREGGLGLKRFERAVRDRPKQEKKRGKESAS